MCCSVLLTFDTCCMHCGALPSIAILSYIVLTHSVVMQFAVTAAASAGMLCCAAGNCLTCASSRATSSCAFHTSWLDGFISMVGWVQEYVRRLGSLILSIQGSSNSPDRPVLDKWVAEARALVCCIKSYNPEALKKLETSALPSGASAERDLSISFCQQQLVSQLLPVNAPSTTCIVHACIDMSTSCR